MTWADVAIIAVCILSAGFGFWRGFAKEALSLATWLAAIWLAWRFTWLIEPFLGEWIAAPELRVWVARGLLFLLVLAAGGLIAWLARALIHRSGLGGTDRALGTFFGLGRGVLIVGLAVIVLELAGLDQDPWWQQSRLRPYGDRVAAGIRYYADLGGQYLREQARLGRVQYDIG